MKLRRNQSPVLIVLLSTICFGLGFFVAYNLLLPRRTQYEPPVPLVVNLDRDGDPIPAGDLPDRVMNQRNSKQVIVQLRGDTEGMNQGKLSVIIWQPRQTDEETLQPVVPPDTTSDPYFKKLDPRLYALSIKLEPHVSDLIGEQPTIAVECDHTLKYEQVLKVMDLLRKMKFINVEVKPIPSEKK